MIICYYIIMDIDRIKELHQTGLSNRQIAVQLDVHHNTIAYHLKKLGLTSNRKMPIELIGIDQAKCKTCKEVKPLSEYQYGRKGKADEYRFAYCNSCRKNQSYAALNRSIEAFLADRHNRLKLRAEKENVVCFITREELIEMYYRQEGRCFYTDQRLNWGVLKGSLRDSLSIDRIVPEKGYISANVVLCTHKANTIKSDLSLSEMRSWMPGWYQRVVDMWRELGLTCFQVAEGNF